jgi:hypothetical protein
LPRAKPGQRFGGRRKGTPNKTTAEVKGMILEALSLVGGVDYLARQAEENPSAFMTLVGKVLPMQIAGDPNQPLVTRIEIVPADGNS